jgi:hypothetical protein
VQAGSSQAERWNQEVLLFMNSKAKVDRNHRFRGDSYVHLKMTMMTEQEIRTELGWTDSMIHSLLQAPDSNTVRRSKTGGYTRGLYKRD